MGLLDSILGAVTGKTDDSGGAARRLSAPRPQRFSDSRRQGLQLRRQQAAPVVDGCVQHLQLEHGADPAQQLVAGDADDAVEIDTTALSAEEVVDRIVDLVERARTAPQR